MKKTTFKIIAILMILTGGVASCERNKNENPCEIKRPTNLKPIDWENYNDVYTVYWTYHKREVLVYEDTAKIIKVYGWVAQNYEHSDFDYMGGDADFFLLGNEAGGNDAPFVPFVIVGGSEIISSLKEKLATADLTKKCYVRGKLTILFTKCIDGIDWGCCLMYSAIRIYSVNDIYFE
ncbi:MAG: hypothetical protein FWE63_01315 [Bacteroidales bacterium]|nr:hypothetical protein [Bacteroidales bacterium]